MLKISANTKSILQSKEGLQESFLGIENSPGFCIAKDPNSKYSVISNDYACLLGWKNAEQCIGLTDYDIPCGAVEVAQDFVKLDQTVISTKISIISLYICQYVNDWKTLLSSKIPIQKEDGQVTGVYGQVIDVSNTDLSSWALKLNYQDLKFKNNKPRIYILNQEQSPLDLTSKQQFCLFFLIRGKSMKEIARILELSPKTVEGHFERIKLKLNCHTKSQLIEKAIHSGFLNYIPEVILNGK